MTTTSAAATVEKQRSGEVEFTGLYEQVPALTPKKGTNQSTIHGPRKDAPKGYRFLVQILEIMTAESALTYVTRVFKYTAQDVKMLLGHYPNLCEDACFNKANRSMLVHYGWRVYVKHDAKRFG